MYKLRTAAALAVGIALVATGCSSPAPSNSVKQDEQAALELWVRTTPGGPGEEGVRKLTEAFEKKSGLTVEVTAIFDDFETKLAQRAAQRDLPDIVLNDSTQLGAMQTQGIVREVDVTKIANSADLVPQALKAAKAVDGKYYGIPYSAQANALMIRSDWLANLGLDAPTTWDEMADVALAFTNDDPDENGANDTYGLTVPGSTKRGYASWYFSNFLWAGGGDFITKQKDGSYTPTTASAKSLKATEWFRDQACVAQVVQPGAVSMDTPPANETFESGLTGMYMVGPYLMPRFDSVLGADKYTVVPAPAGPADSSVLAEGGTIYLMAGSNNETGQDAFADYMISPAGQKLGMQGDKAFIVQLPVNSTVDITEVRDDPRWETYADAYKSSGRYAPTIPNWTPVRQMSADTVNALLADCTLDLKTELERLDGKLTAELLTQGILTQ